MTQTPNKLPRKPQSLPLQLWNALGILAAFIVAFAFFWSIVLAAMPRWYYRTVTIATIYLLVWLLNKRLFQPMVEQMRQDKADKDKNAG